jgi:serine/threonine-protein kinase HipA
MKVGGPQVWEAMVRLVERVEPALERIGQTLPQDFPPRTWNAISQGMRSQAARFLGGLASLS